MIKYVDGKPVEMTEQEIAEFDKRKKDIAAQIERKQQLKNNQRAGIDKILENATLGDEQEAALRDLFYALINL